MVRSRSTRGGAPFAAKARPPGLADRFAAAARDPARHSRRRGGFHFRVRAGCQLPEQQPAGLCQLPRHAGPLRFVAEFQPSARGGLQRLPPAARSVGKWVTKADNGFFHSLAFTLENFHEPIQIKPRNRRVTQNACLHCHADLVHQMLPAESDGEMLACVHCHSRRGPCPAVVARHAGTPKETRPARQVENR